MNGPCLASWCEVGLKYVGVHKGRFGLQNKIQAVLIFANKLKFTERGAPQSDHHHCWRTRAAVSTGLHPRQATGLNVVEGGKLYPNRIGGEVVARGAGGVRG